MTGEEALARFKEADALFRKGRHQDAYNMLHTVSLSFPDRASVLYPMALCLTELDRLPEARDLCEALVRDHGHAAAREHLRVIEDLEEIATEAEEPGEPAPPPVDLEPVSEPAATQPEPASQPELPLEPAPASESGPLPEPQAPATQPEGESGPAVKSGSRVRDGWRLALLVLLLVAAVVLFQRLKSPMPDGPPGSSNGTEEPVTPGEPFPVDPSLDDAASERLAGAMANAERDPVSALLTLRGVLATHDFPAGIPAARVD